MKEMYAQLGISSEVYDFGHKIEESLKERFEKFDKTAEYNQMKVLLAMQKNKVSAECFGSSSGYGYDDIGRETLEKVYADTFHTEACLVRPQITCGTHALAIALFGNLRPDTACWLCREPGLTKRPSKRCCMNCTGHSMTPALNRPRRSIAAGRSKDAGIADVHVPPHPRSGGGSCPVVPVLADRFWGGAADLVG